MFRRTRKNPLATIKDFTEGDVIPDAATDYLSGLEFGFNGDGYPVIGGVPTAGPPLSFLPGGLWGSLAGKPFLIPEDFGAVGDGSTDDATALRAMFLAAATTGASIQIPFGKVYASTLPIDVKTNTYVFGSGTLKCLAEHSAGGFILIKNATANVKWFGPALDINGVVNMNGFAVGDVPNSTDFVSDIHIVSTVRGARIKTALEDENNALYAGGGKAVTVQFRARNVYANVICIDNDISCSVEAAVSDTRHLENVVLDIWSRDAHRTHLYVGGSKDPSISSNDSASYAHSIYPGVKINLYARGGMDASILHPVTGEEQPNYSEAGVVTLHWASGIDLTVYAAIQNRCTLLRGPAAASSIKIVNALMDSLQDVWDTRPLDTLPASPQMLPDNVIEANVHAKTHESGGVVIRPHRVSTSRTLIKSVINVRMWVQNGVGPITQDDGTTDEFGVSVDYTFRDMRSSPVKKVDGLSSHVVKPTWAMAPSGGRVALQRESWHDGTREVAAFDATNGWQFRNIAYNQRPLIFGASGGANRFLHYDATSGVLRVAGSAPGAATSGGAIALQGSVTVADGVTTPSATAASLLVTGNTTATSITNLTDGYTGQVVTIRFNDTNTTVVHGSGIRLKSGRTRRFPMNGTLTLVSSSGGWYEIGNDTLAAAAALNFPSVAAQSYQDLTISLPGAATGDAVALGLPDTAALGGLLYQAWVSAADTVTVRANNFSSGAIDPPAASFRVVIAH